MVTIQYPPQPVDKQYGDWFPAIPVKGVPAVEGVIPEKDSPVAVHPESSGTAQKSSDTLSIPVRLDFGALKVWLSAGRRVSASFDDGPSFNYEKEGITQEPNAGDPDFNFAPGTDEGKLTVNWQVHGTSKIKSAHLELYGKGIATPIWSHKYGSAFGAEDSPFTAFSLVQDDLTASGSIPFTSIVIPKAALFPKGHLTMAHAPYQLKLTVSGCTAPNEPADGDKFAYPSTAWTYLHVVTAGFAITPGPKTWLDNKRDDVDVKLRPRVIGTRTGGNYGYEGDILGQLGTANLSAGQLTDIRVKANVGLDPEGGEFAFLKKMWGQGPRIPLVAKALLKDVEGNAIADAGDVLVGTRVMWDWTDNHPTRWQDTLEAVPFKTNKTADYLKLLHLKFSTTLEPKGSCNCPIDYGGKYGDATAPIFPLQDGTGAFPFKVEAAKTRTWAALTTLDKDGTCAVMFQPSRLAGDRYDVACYPYLPALETKDPALAVTGPGGKGSAGTFEVVRERTIQHVVMGLTPNVDILGMTTTVKDAARKQASVYLDFKPVVIDLKTLAQKAMTALEKTAGILNSPFFSPLILRSVLDLNAAPTSAAFSIHGHDALKDSIRAKFKAGRLALVTVKVTELPKESTHMRLSWTGGTSHANSLDFAAIDPAPAKPALGTHWLLSDGPKPFQDKDALTNPVATGTTINIRSVGSTVNCWGFAITEAKTSTSATTLTVTFPNASTHVVTYGKKGIGNSRKVKKSSSSSEQKSLRKAFKAAVTAFAATPEAAFTVQITSQTSQSPEVIIRVQRLTTFLQSMVDAERLLVDRKARAEAYIRGDLPSYLTGQWKDVAKKAPLAQLSQGMATELFTNGDVEEGVIYFHCERITNISDLPEAATLDGVTKPAYKDIPYGASFPTFHTTSDPFVNVVYGATPLLDAPLKFKPLPTIFIHELGHAVGLNHAPYADVVRVEDRAKWNIDFGAAARNEHLAQEGCLMDYYPSTLEYCALCRYRHRGWDWRKLPNDASVLVVTAATINVELGDLAPIFGGLAHDSLGQLQRLQVLGLHTRPLDHFNVLALTEAEVFSLNYARTLLGVRDLAGVLDDEVRNFIVEGGALPAAGKQARLRLPNTWSPIYSILDKMHEHPGHKNDDPPNSLDLSSPGADRARVEKQIFDANWAMGAIPLRLTITEMIGKTDSAPWAGAHLFITLVKPDTLTPISQALPAITVAGAKSYLKGTAAVATKGKGSAFIEKEAAKYKEDPADPTTGNTHFEMGGKRGLADDKNLGQAHADGSTNLFSDLEYEDLPATGYGPDDVVPPTVKVPTAKAHTLCVVADDQGVVELLFWPSRVSGDRYKLKFHAEDPTSDSGTKYGEITTGTMVRWRTVRVADYFAVKRPASVGTLAGPLATMMRAKNKNFAPLTGANNTTIDLTGAISNELAKSYNELLIAPGAEVPKPFASPDWQAVRTELNLHLARYPESANTTTKVAGVVFTDPLVPDHARKIFKGTTQGQHPSPNSVQIRPAAASLMTDSIAHDWRDPLAEGDAPLENLVAINKDELVCGNPSKKRTGAKVDVKGSVNYTTGEVTVEFAKAQPETAAYKVVYCADDFIDMDALLVGPDEQPASTPFLMPYRLPAAYDALVRPGYLKMGDGIQEAPKQGVYISGRGFSTNTSMLGAIARGLDGNKQALVPGIIIVQSAALDLYSALYMMGEQEGKGWTNVVFVHQPAAHSDPAVFRERINTLFAHEMGHTLYLSHAPDGPKSTQAPGNVPLLHDAADNDCLMSYSTRVEGRDHCGLCLATLRGMSLYDSPLTKGAAHPHKDFLGDDNVPEEEDDVPVEDVPVVDDHPEINNNPVVVKDEPDQGP